MNFNEKTRFKVSVHVLVLQIQQ